MDKFSSPTTDTTDVTSEPIRLTRFASSGGCAAKVGPGDLLQLVMPEGSMRIGSAMDQAVLVGTETGDDAGVYLIRDASSDGTALVQTVDFITPLVDEPELYGQIAAANALSDVYAMGGRPLSALNICVFPKELPPVAARAIFAGALRAIQDAGAVLLGGHTVRGPELLFGLSVTGVVHPARIWRNVGARPGDQLILTKPLGAGLLTSALRKGLVSLDDIAPSLAQLATLNRRTAEILSVHPVSAATDVTGFGLVGHSLGMTRSGSVSLHLDCDRVPAYDEALRIAEAGVTCGGATNNRAAFLPHVSVRPTLSAARIELIFDPQTSGGLLVALPAQHAPTALAQLHDAGIAAAIIGEASERDQYPLYAD